MHSSIRELDDIVKSRFDRLLLCTSLGIANNGDVRI